MQSLQYVCFMCTYRETSTTCVLHLQTPRKSLPGVVLFFNEEKKNKKRKKKKDEQFPKLTKHLYHHARRANFRGLFQVWL